MEGTSSRRAPVAADAKIPASEATTPKVSSSGYKKSRASTVGQKKQHKSAAKVGAMSPRADRKVVSKLDTKGRTPSIPFLEPLQIGPEKAPAKQDTDLSLQEERTSFAVAADSLSIAGASPQKKEGERDMVFEESIQEEIPATISPLEVSSRLEEKEDEPVPEHIDAKHEEEGYHDVDAIAPVPSLHDAVEESPIAEEIGFASPAKEEADSDRAVVYDSHALTNAQDDSYENDQHSFEPEASFVELVAPLATPADEPILESELGDKAAEDEFEVARATVVEGEGVAISPPGDEEKMTISELLDAKGPVSKETTPEDLVTSEAAHETHAYEDTWGRKSEEDEGDVPLAPSEVEPSSFPISEQKPEDAEIDEYEFVELPVPNQDDLTILLDWSAARDTCHEFTGRGITDALVEVEAMGACIFCYHARRSYLSMLSAARVLMIQMYPLLRRPRLTTITTSLALKHVPSVPRKTAPAAPQLQLRTQLC